MLADVLQVLSVGRFEHDVFLLSNQMSYYLLFLRLLLLL